MFSYLSFFLYYEKPFDALMLRIWMDFFFPKWSFVLIYNSTFPQEQSAYSHSVETWESLSSGERNNLPIIYLRVPQGKSIAYGSSWRENWCGKVSNIDVPWNNLFVCSCF